ncbi:MAG TPA: CBS domain-containing protein [Steroidobacteraceae bacterium]|nr:CBS domain-containing protein [Steroidobacteraceae bacterium]HRX89539.1 CBS domain-containing protein [Steroidobacteraceae bacterium]
MISVEQLLAGKRSQAVFAVEPDTPVLEAIRLMAAKYVGAVLVMKGKELVGIVSERDYARKVVLMGRSSSETPVWQIMSSPVLTVAPRDRVNDCMRRMTEKRIRHLPVVDAGEVIGVISIGDLVKSVIEEQERTIADLEEYIHR